MCDLGETLRQAAGMPGPEEHAALVQRHAAATRASERRRWQVLVLLAEGRPLEQIVAVTGCRPRTIRQIAQRYCEAGPAGLVDGRQHCSGAAPILTLEQQHELQLALQGPPPDGGVWTGPKVARWIAAKAARPVHRQRGWEYLRRLGWCDPAADLPR